MTLAALLVQGAACARPPRLQPPAAPGPVEAARHRAALASVTAENHTPHTLTLAFRSAGTPGGVVSVGTVAPGASTVLAPVPAGEPIVLIARRADRAVFELEPRSFAIDEQWRWIIPSGATFRSPPEAP